jgi:hypothetical protein
VERTCECLFSWLEVRDGEIAAADALTAGGRVLVRAGFAAMGKTVEVRTLAPSGRDGVTIVRMRWSASRPAGDLFPALDANLEITARAEPASHWAG